MLDDIFKASVNVPCVCQLGCLFCSLGCFLHVLDDLVSVELGIGFLVWPLRTRLCASHQISPESNYVQTTKVIQTRL